MAKTAKIFVEKAREYLGVKEGSKRHKELMDVYNAHRPLAHGYEMTYEDAWCAAFVSAISILCGFTDIIPTDCRCSSFITKFKKLDSWLEDEDRTPSVGDIVFYDWEDSGNGDNKSTPNHVGIVSEVRDGEFDVIEGNKNNAVGERIMRVNGRYLRGFAVPKWDKEHYEPPSDESVSSYSIHIVKPGDTLGKLARKYGTTIRAIQKANKQIKNVNLIYDGDELIIPNNRG